MIDFRDFEDPQTKRIDWSAYREAQKNVGEICEQCNQYIISLNFFGGKRETGRRKCYDCNSMDSRTSESVTHESRIRCPKCLHQTTVEPEEGWYRVYSDGGHEVECDECGHEFTIVTRVTYEFESPVAEEQA